MIREESGRTGEKMEEKKRGDIEMEKQAGAGRLIPSLFFFYIFLFFLYVPSSFALATYVLTLSLIFFASNIIKFPHSILLHFPPPVLLVFFLSYVFFFFIF